jgi:hypothetical protein
MKRRYVLIGLGTVAAIALISTQLVLPGSATTGTASPTNNDISVSTFDATGAAAERAFRLAVFC